MKNLLQGKLIKFYPEDEEHFYTALITHSTNKTITAFALNYKTDKDIVFKLKNNKWISKEPIGRLEFINKEDRND